MNVNTEGTSQASANMQEYQDQQASFGAEASLVAGQQTSNDFTVDRLLAGRNISSVTNLDSLESLAYIETIIKQLDHLKNNEPDAGNKIELQLYLDKNTKKKFTVFNKQRELTRFKFSPNKMLEVIATNIINMATEKFLTNARFIKSLIIIAPKKNYYFPMIGDKFSNNIFQAPRIIVSNSGLRLVKLTIITSESIIKVTDDKILEIINCDLKKAKLISVAKYLHLEYLRNTQNLFISNVISLTVKNGTDYIPYSSTVENLYIENCTANIPIEYLINGNLKSLTIKNSNIIFSKPNNSIESDIEITNCKSVIISNCSFDGCLSFTNCESIRIQNTKSLKNIYLAEKDEEQEGLQDNNQYHRLKDFICRDNPDLTSIQGDGTIKASLNIINCALLTGILNIENNGDTNIYNCSELRVINLYSHNLCIGACPELLYTTKNLFPTENPSPANTIRIINVYNSENFLKYLAEKSAGKKIKIPSAEIINSNLVIVSNLPNQTITSKCYYEILIEVMLNRFEDIYEILPSYSGKILEEDIQCPITKAEIRSTDPEDPEDKIKNPVAVCTTKVKTIVYDFYNFLQCCEKELKKDEFKISGVILDPYTRLPLDFNKIYKLNDDNVIWNEEEATP